MPSWSPRHRPLSRGAAVPAPRTPSDPAAFPTEIAGGFGSGGGDPRERDDGLGWVTRAVFGDPRLRLGTDRGPEAVDGMHTIARYAVIGGLDGARFLLPLGTRAATMASVLAYNGLRPPKVRAGRAAISVLAGCGALALARPGLLSIRVAAGTDPAEVLLTAHLADLLGVARLHAAIGIRPPDPHHKPTLQLFDDAGRPRGYAKIGWNTGTRAMVRAEAATLTGLPGPDNVRPAPRCQPAADVRPSAGDLPVVPRLVRHTRWQDREIAVIAPMPRAVRRIRRPDTPRCAAILAVARRGGPPAPALPLRGSALLAGWRRRAAGAPGIVAAALDALERRDGDVPVEFGDWHGDWVPWNMARHRGRLHVWDWENHGTGVPVGFDLAHQAFQMALSLEGQPAARAADAATDLLRTHGAVLGLGRDQQRLVADGYLIELWLRTYELSEAGWNARLHPALLDILADRLALPALDEEPADHHE